MFCNPRDAFSACIASLEPLSTVAMTTDSPHREKSELCAAENVDESFHLIQIYERHIAALNHREHTHTHTPETEDTL